MTITSTDHPVRDTPNTAAANPPAPPVTRTGIVTPPVPRRIPARFSPRELLLAVRPHQWVKNSLVLVAPVVTGVVVHPTALLAALVATAAFCAASAATYLVNDIADVDADKLHPTKQLRPLAAGTLSIRHASIAAVGIGLLAFGLAIDLGWLFVAVLAVYLVKTTAYSKRLKHIAIVDVATVAVGFVLRVVAGAVAVGVGVSISLLVAVWAGAALISLGKRHAEVGRLGASAGDHRTVLNWYRPTRTTAMMIASEVVAVAAVGMWSATAFDVTVAVAIAAVVAVILDRFRRLVRTGDVDDPVHVISHDRPIAIATVTLGIVMIAGMLL